MEIIKPEGWSEARWIQHLLSRPFPANQIHWVNKGKGGELAYINARDVMKRLDDVLGFDGWSDEIVFHENTAICKLTLRIPTTEHSVEYVTKSDASGESNFEAEKGASSTAFKRAAAKFGVGRYLYYFQGVSRNNIPAWATPEGYDKIKGLS